MKLYSRIVILAAVVFLAVSPAIAQEAKEASPAAPAADMPSTQDGATAADVKAAAPAQETAPASKDASIYGEVLSVNAANSTMTVQYYDYDTDEEKTVDLTVNSATKLENAAAIADVKKGDWVDVLYTAGTDSSLAKSVMVEKEEALPSETPTGMEEDAQSLQ